MHTRQLVLMFVLLCGTVYGFRKFPLAAAPIVSAARGDVDVDHDNNGNTKLKVTTEYLTPPNGLTPPVTAYIVWIQEPGGMPQAQGQLKVDKNRKAKFETVISAKNFELFVTAEQDPTVKAPGGAEILKATIQP
jgi:hypothetical protein